MNKWSEINIGDTIYMITPVIDKKDQELLPCKVLDFAINNNVKQYFITIENSQHNIYNLFIKYSDNDKDTIFTHFYYDTHGFGALIGLNKKNLIKYYIVELENICKESYHVYLEAKSNFEELNKKLQIWKNKI